MSKSLKFSGMALALAALAIGATAQAQTSTSASRSGMSSSYGSSWYAPAGGRYIGFNAGRSDYFGNCDASDILSLSCDNTGTAYSIYTGGMWNNNLGMELGATDFGRIDRLGGSTKAYGFNLSAVGRVPMTDTIGLFAKVGAMYSRSEVGVGATAVGANSGKDTGWGPTYGVGVDFSLTPKLAAVLQWDQSKVPVLGDRERINVTSVGLKYRF